MKTAIEETGNETLEQLIALAKAANETEINGIPVNTPFPKVEAAQPKQRFEYRLYPDVPVTLNYQNQGSTWMLILRGKKNHVEQVFNGLANLGGTTSAELQYTDARETTAVCWSSPKEMREFFGLRQELRKGGRSEAHIEHEFKTFKNNCSEVFIDFHSINLGEPPELHDILKTSAENPDNDFRDAMWVCEARALMPRL